MCVYVVTVYFLAIDCLRTCVCVMRLVIDGTVPVGVEYFVIVSKIIAVVKYNAHATQFVVVIY